MKHIIKTHKRRLRYYFIFKKIVDRFEPPFPWQRPWTLDEKLAERCDFD